MCHQWMHHSWRNIQPAESLSFVSSRLSSAMSICISHIPIRAHIERIHCILHVNILNVNSVARLSLLIHLLSVQGFQSSPLPHIIIYSRTKSDITLSFPHFVHARNVHHVGATQVDLYLWYVTKRQVDANAKTVLLETNAKPVVQVSILLFCKQDQAVLGISIL